MPGAGGSRVRPVRWRKRRPRRTRPGSLRLDCPALRTWKRGLPALRHCPSSCSGPFLLRLSPSHTVQKRVVGAGIRSAWRSSSHRLPGSSRPRRWAGGYSPRVSPQADLRGDVKLTADLVTDPSLDAADTTYRRRPSRLFHPTLENSAISTSGTAEPAPAAAPSTRDAAPRDVATRQTPPAIQAPAVQAPPAQPPAPAASPSSRGTAAAVRPGETAAPTRPAPETATESRPAGPPAGSLSTGDARACP